MYCTKNCNNCPIWTFVNEKNKSDLEEIVPEIMHINKKYSKRYDEIKYIVIHDTANYSSGADALRHYYYFKDSIVQSSAHYVVDDTQAIELISPEYAAWHAGDGRGRFGIRNSNSIGIEMCVNGDSDYDKMMKNTLSLVKILMKKYKIKAENVVRHYDASRKLCPGSMSVNNWEMWKKFKNSL